MNNIIDVVRRTVEEEIGNVEISNDDILLESGLDSISIINVVTTLEEKFDIEFDPGKLTYETLRTINSISEYILEELNNK